MSKVCLIGAGISGLVAARSLYQKGFSVTVLEKSRSLSGRCATRLWNGHVVDHGLQYFTADDDSFLCDVKETVGSGLANLEVPIVDGEGVPINDNKTRYYLKEGNNRIGKYLIPGIKILRESLVRSVQHNTWGIRVEGEGFSDDFDAVIISVPLPQAAAMLNFQSSNEIYSPCLTAFFEYEGLGIGLAGRRYAVVKPDAYPSLGWSACENHKQSRINGQRTVMVVQASVDFSRTYLEAEPAEYLPELREGLEALWKLPSGAFLDQFAHRWRYARRQKDAPDVSRPTPEGMFHCGDSRVRSRLESVWMDGHRVAAEVEAYLS